MISIHNIHNIYVLWKASSETAWMSAKINVVILVGEYTKNILPVKSYVRTSEEQNSCLITPIPVHM